MVFSSSVECKHLFHYCDTGGGLYIITANVVKAPQAALECDMWHMWCKLGDPTIWFMVPPQQDQHHTTPGTSHLWTTGKSMNQWMQNAMNVLSRKQKSEFTGVYIYMMMNWLIPRTIVNNGDRNRAHIDEPIFSSWSNVKWLEMNPRSNKWSRQWPAD